MKYEGAGRVEAQYDSGIEGGFTFIAVMTKPFGNFASKQLTATSHNS
jgi:hypothetical protein